MYGRVQVLKFPKPFPLGQLCLLVKILNKPLQKINMSQPGGKFANTELNNAPLFLD
jgi:hypothetical protein